MKQAWLRREPLASIEYKKISVSERLPAPGNYHAALLLAGHTRCLRHPG